ncbi:hypothetical protein KO361_06100 [Candidatus Woesearchaeota archaeon]|nr:hypothetical protein [Candidatus Woesearchaeota archaeon]
MKGIKTKLENAEKTKKKLSELKVINTEYKIKKDDTHIYFPIKKEPKQPNFEVIETNFEKNIQKEKDLKKILIEKLSSQELEKLKTSFDTIGEIAILEIDEELRQKEKIIAEALLKSHKNIKTVLRKDDKHDGEFRTQRMKWLTGKNTKEATHKENNITLKLNVETVYFSPRLSTERKRIAELVKKDEEILVMFSGCAPYPCVLAKNTEAKHITGIELNPEGHKYGIKNLEINKIKNVTLINGDVKTQTTQIYKNIIGLKSNIQDLQTRLIHEPKIMELHLFKEDLHENKETLEKTIQDLKQQNLEVFIHMPFPINGEKILGEQNSEKAIQELTILGEICKKHNTKAIIHITEGKPLIKDEQIINNITRLRNYYNYFYFENLTAHFNTTEEIIRIGKKAGIKNTCIDIAHLYKTYKNNEEIIKHIKEMQKHYNTYFHLSDSDGEKDALSIGTGNININNILPLVNKGITEVKSKKEEDPKEMIASYKEIISKKRTFDRIIMPLPKNAEDFLEDALNVSKKGTIIHFYNFLHETEFEEAEHKVKEACTKKGFKYKKIKLIKAGQQSPRTYRICLDFQVQ